jgi:hypothetical protein
MKSAAIDKDRKRAYLKPEAIGIEIMKHPTPGVATSENPDDIKIVPLPIQEYPLSTWLGSLRDFPELCHKYGFSFSDMSPLAIESPEDTTASPERQHLRDEDLTAEHLEELAMTGKSATEEMTGMLDDAVRNTTDPVFSL